MLSPLVLSPIISVNILFAGFVHNSTAFKFTSKTHDPTGLCEKKMLDYIGVAGSSQ